MWFKIDDGFYDHPKWWDASDAAVALWVKCGSWSAQYLTDGYIPAGIAARFAALCPDAADELLGRGLWIDAPDGGYQFHDWTDWQPSRQQVLEQRKRNAERQARFRLTDRNAVTNAVTDSVSSDVTAPVSNTAPTRPTTDALRASVVDARTRERTNPPGSLARTRSTRTDGRTVADAIAAATPPYEPDEDDLP